MEVIALLLFVSVFLFGTDLAARTNHATLCCDEAR
jgi:hypothetical protein